MQPASASDMQPAISLLEKTPRLLETMLGDLSGELLHWKPAPDRWSISEVLAHLAALEQVYTERTLRMVAEDSPALTKYDQAGATSRGEYSRGSAGENLALFTRTRRSTLALLLGFQPPRALASEFIRNSEASRSRNCSTNGRIMTSATCGKSRSSIEPMRFIPIPGPS
jgi:hypothetical protein